MDKYIREYYYPYLCRCGYIKLIKLLIITYSVEFETDVWNDGLSSGSEFTEIVNFMIEKGATNYNHDQLMEFKKSKEFKGLNDNIIKLILNKY